MKLPLLLAVMSLLAPSLSHASDGMTHTMVERMVRMAELRDPKETGPHVVRVGAIAAELYTQWASRHGIEPGELERQRDILRMAAMLHDVGKVGIPDAILLKPGRLTPEEFERMKAHSILGARLFVDGTSEYDKAALDVALTHHERWDGTGDPGHVDVLTGLPLPGMVLPDGGARGKEGLEIPLFGRVTAIADVYDAMRRIRNQYPDER